MDIEKTIQFLMDNAAAHDARLAEIERNSLILQRAMLGLTEHQGSLQSALERTEKQIAETQKALRELGEKTDERIAKLVSAIAKLSDQRPNGRPN